MAKGDRLMRFQQSPLDNWISNAIHVCTNDKKPEQIPRLRKETKQYRKNE